MNEPRYPRVMGTIRRLVVGSLFAKGGFRPVLNAWLTVLVFLLCGCSNEASDSQAKRAQLEEEAQRQSESSEIDTEIEAPAPDDERSLERRIEDASLAAQVRLALVDERSLRLFDFEPTVVNGRVLLRGEVRTQDQRNDAERVAGSIAGVREVINDVTATEEPSIAESSASRDSLLALAAGDDRSSSGDAETSAEELSDDPSPSSSADGESASEPDSEETASQPAEEPEVHHTVRSGDSLWEIAREYGVTVEQITRLNNLQSNRLMPGQQLRVK